MRAAATPKGERRRQALVVAAADLLLEGGFDAVRHRSVAQRASLPLASTTYYFQTLADLLAAAAEHTGFTELDANRRQVLEISHRRRGTEASAELIVDVLFPDDSRPEAVTAGFERMLGSARIPELRSVHVKLRSQTVELITEVLRRCGRTASSDQARALIHIADGAALNAICDGSGNPKASARTAVTAVVDVIAPQIAR
ncbi:MAG: TetR family transcriptional regulator C-terminal domain-containing protein [Nocardiaceae bacterium]|nr:TetR family transcriptional regulator C-terminal domain-containing protein [Nocardiaceae bacterium]